MLQAIRIQSAAEPCFGRVWQLYEKSFPLEERRPFPFHADAMEREPSFVCLRLQEDTDTDALAADGLLFYWQLPVAGIYVEHLAVSPERRGQGIGHAALQFLETLGQPVILEIEPVADARTRRRLHFYESAGYVRLPYPHAQLPFRRGGAPVPMELLSLRQPMPEAEVARFQEYLQGHIMQYREH